MIILLSLYFFDSSFLEIETISFTVLIFTEYLLTLTELNKPNLVSIVSTVLSMLMYIIILLWMQDFFEIGDIMKWEYIYKILAIIAISWLPLFIF